MRIVANQSAYDARAVRRVLQAVVRQFGRTEWPVLFWRPMRVQLLEWRGAGVKVEMVPSETKLYLPALRGAEFIGLARQQHGGQSGVDHGGLTATAIALALQPALFAQFGMLPPAWCSNVVMGGSRTLRRTPERIPLRIIKPKAPRDKLRERYARTVELEKAWQRKAKLAATKLKKVRQFKARYAKQLLQRQEAQ